VARKVTSALQVAEPVRSALDGGRAVVGFETSVLAQGLPPPRNLAVARAMSDAVRERGCEPAWIWVGDGAVRVGATEEELEALAGGAAKAARRDLPMLVARRALGATTVSATAWAAHRAGVEIMGTGGIGGVHIGSGDVSADLLELARTPVSVVCSGPKSILDPAATLERIEELGIGVIGYGCDRLPFFVVREAPLALEHRADSPDEVAAAIASRRALGIDGALLVCNPVPEREALQAEEVGEAVARCTASAEAQGVTGKALTPYLLRCLAERTDGASVAANVALLESNAALAGEIAARSV